MGTIDMIARTLSGICVMSVVRERGWGGRERETDRETDKDRQKETERERKRKTETETERERERERETHTHTQRHTHRHRQRQRVVCERGKSSPDKSMRIDLDPGDRRNDHGANLPT